MENFALVALVESLKPAMADLIIRRVVQHQTNGFIFQTRSIKLPAFKVILESQHPSIFASDVRPPMETPNSDFLMVLRKHLTSAEVTTFHKPLSERIVEFGFKTVVPSKELEYMSLIVELLPNAPNLILLDEPTVGVDVGAKVEIYRLIGELAQQGAGILLLSSDLLELLGIADRILVMYRGRLAGEFNAGNTTSAELLSRATGASTADDVRVSV